MAGAGGGYAAAMMGVVDLMSGASVDAAYEAAYGQYYKAYAGQMNASNRKVAAEANISAIKQDKINTDVVIDMQQDQAEARAKVMAAVSGAEGQSVDAVIAQTEFNSSVAQSNNKKNAEQQIENQLAAIYQSQSTMLALDNVDVHSPSIGMALAGGLSTVMLDGAMMGELASNIEGIFGVDATLTE